MKTIGYVTPYNPFEDRIAFSGVIFNVRVAIEKAGFKVIWIPYNSSIKRNIFEKICNKFFSFIGQSRFTGGLCEKDLKRWASTIDASKIKECDALFFPANTQIAIYINTEKPIINLSDATAQQMMGYYWNGFSKKADTEANRLEIMATKISNLFIRPSQWATDSLIKDCGAEPQKCYVLEYGPCIDKQKIIPIQPWQKGRMNILFSGVDWERKGGSIAIETTRLLRQNGIDAHIFIVGPRKMPKECHKLDFVTFIGFLDKNNPFDYSRYIELFKESHIFLLPTRAECAGIVFAEASAFGLPCYSYNTGGVPNYVIDERNGHLLPTGSTATDFCKCILADITNSRLEEYHKGGIELSRTKMSWDVWSEKFAAIVDRIY